jgi:serine/threonine protein kinase
MSKLVDMNPRMTPLTQVPGTPAYMPPEALITPPHYSSKLDCFSHGVLTLQIITRNFPNPGDASRYVEDPRYPAGRVLVQFLESERRKKDIDLIAPSHPLLPIALHCLKDRDTERPSADELCRRLALLKRETPYTHSVEQTRGRIQRLQEEVNMKDSELQGNQQLCTELQRSNEQLHKQLHKKQDELQRANDQLQRSNEEKEEQILSLQKKVEALETRSKEDQKSFQEPLSGDMRERASSNRDGIEAKSQGTSTPLKQESHAVGVADNVVSCGIG